MDNLWSIVILSLLFHHQAFVFVQLYNIVTLVYPLYNVTNISEYMFIHSFLDAEVHTPHSTFIHLLQLLTFDLPTRDVFERNIVVVVGIHIYLFTNFFGV